MKKLLPLICFSLLFLPQLFFASGSSNWVKKYEPQKNFIENKGQFSIKETAGFDSKVEFAFDGSSQNYFFTKSGVVFELVEMKKPKESEREEREMKELMKKGKMTAEEHAKMEAEENRMIITKDELRAQWLGANPNVQILAEDKNAHHYSYSFKNADGKLVNENFVACYKKLTYKNLYPNIDVVYEMHPQTGVKYSVIVHPGGDVSQVKLQYSKNAHLLADGTIKTKSKFGNFIDHAPATFYEDDKNPIASSYVLNNNIVSFNVANFNANKTIVIDPWTQSPAFNTQWDCVWECDKDAAGNVYIIGGVMPMQLLKYSSAGALQWTYNTPYDSTHWMGSFAVDNAGNSFVTQGSAGEILRVNTSGGLVWSNTSPGGLFGGTELWRVSFNCDQTKLVVGGTGGTLNLGPYIYNIDLNTGNVLNSTQVTAGGLNFATGIVQEVRAITSCGNAKYYFMTHDSIGYIHQSLTSCLSTGTYPFHTRHNYSFGYKVENWRNENSGIEAIRSFGGYVYTHRGNQVHKRDFNTANIVATGTIPGGQWNTSGFGNSVGCSGIDIDSCGNVYVGATNGVVKFDANLNQLGTFATSFNVYDVVVTSTGDLIAAGSTGTSSSGARTGSVQSFAAGACKTIAIICCDPSICQPVNKCTTDPPFNLTATTAGGVWSGTGITNTTNGTFSPAVSGAGTFKVYYTLACGKDSTIVTVNTCSATSVCKETNGNLTVSGGTGPYTWSYWQYATSTTVTNAATCTACGGTWNAFVGQCLNGIFPVSSCNTPAAWVQFGTGVTVTPPAGKDSIKVVDNAGTTVTIYGLATLAPCSACPTLTVTPANQVNVKCFGQATGSFSVTTTGGASPYNYVLKNGATTVATFNAVAGSQPFTGLPAGTYTLNVTDKNGCPGTSTVTILQPTAALAVSTTPTATTCGKNNGSATSTVTGGTTNYTYVWNNAGGSASAITNVAANTYTVTVTDANACTATASAVINTSTAITATASATATTCGAANGTATANVSLGTGPFTYVWSNTQTSNPAINLAATTYTVTITGAGGCTATASATVNSSTAITATASATATTCGAANGTATATVSAGTGPFTYLWSNTQTSNPAINLAAATYAVTITGAGGCTATASATVNPSAAPNITAVSKTDETCLGQGNGSINSATTTGGTGALQYGYALASNPLAVTPILTFPVTNVAAGTYIVGVQDASGCRDTFYITLNPGPNCCGLAFKNITIAQPGCTTATGSIDVLMTNGTPPYTYTWSANAATGNSPTASNLSSGTYGVTVQAGVNCVRDTSITLTAPNAPNITAVNTSAPSCSVFTDGSLVSATTTGGTGTLQYGYALSTNPLAVTPIVTFPVTNLAAGTYILGVQDANSCRDTFWFTIAPGPNCCNHTLSGVLTQPTCTGNNGAVDLSVANGSGQFTYLWSTTDVTQDISSLNAATYSVTVTDTIYKCTKDTSFVLAAPNSPNINSIVTTNETCLGQGDGSLTAANTTGGTGTLQYGYALSSNPLAITPIVTFPVTNLAAGTYILGVQDANSCRDTFWFTIVAGPKCCNLSLSATLTQPTCGNANGGIDVTVIQGSGNYQYTWNGTVQSQDTSNVSAGNYTLHLDDITQACTIDTTFALNNSNGPVIDSFKIKGESCAGTVDGAVTVFTSGTVNVSTGFTWANSSNTTDTRSGIAAGTYFFTVTDNSSCSTFGSVVIPGGGSCCTLQSSTNSTPTTCGKNNGSITVTISQGKTPYDYSIDNGATYGTTNLFQNLASGTYDVIARDADCSDTFQVTVTASSGLSFTQNATDISCNGKQDGTISINVTNGAAPINYTWSNGLPNQATQNGLAANTYTVTITDKDNCTNTAQATINEPAPLTVSVGVDTIQCGGTITLVAQTSVNPVQYVWSTGEQTASITVDKSATYGVTVTAGTNCTASDETQVTIYTQPQLELGQDTFMYSGQSIQLDGTVTGGSGSGTYLWTPSSFVTCNNCPTPKAVPTDKTTFYVVYTDNKGCLVSDSITINVLDDGNLEMPNAFTPNSDGKNDEFKAIYRSVKEFKMSIFNRWGELVYQSNDIDKGWDGVYKGVLQPPAVYVYYVTATFYNNKSVNKQGSLTLIR